MKSMKYVAAILALALVLSGGSISSQAQLESQLLAGTTAQWWQFAISIPASVNQLLDTTGDNCMVGQRDPIWFLAGTFLGDKAERDCAIPAGVWLFFPVINSVQVNSPGICGQTGSLSVAELRNAAASVIDPATGMHIKVDGIEVNKPVRIKSNVFATTFPVDNIFNLLCGGPGSVHAGVYSRSVDDGYYVLLKPLSIGKHTLTIDAVSGGFTVAITYNLTVCSPSQSGSVPCSGS